MEQTKITAWRRLMDALTECTRAGVVAWETGYKPGLWVALLDGHEYHLDTNLMCLRVFELGGPGEDETHAIESLRDRFDALVGLVREMNEGRNVVEQAAGELSKALRVSGA